MGHGQELHLIGLHCRKGLRSAATAIARSPGLIRRGFACPGHGSRIPFDQAAQAGGWNQRAFADLAGFQFTLTDKLDTRKNRVF